MTLSISGVYYRQFVGGKALAEIGAEKQKTTAEKRKCRINPLKSLAEMVGGNAGGKGSRFGGKGQLSY